MPPVRTHDAASTSDHKSTNERPHKRRRIQQTLSTEISTPGISKLKASLRQTRRLLAKDTLAADVRVDTERRLHALEAELAAAEQANKERAMATKYHRIKFFDRKKLLRRVKQVQRQLDADELPSKERKKLERTLGDLRVDLNYVTHYPKAERYISLFPPEVRQHEHEDVETRAVEPIRLKKGEEPEDATDRRREELRAWVRERMETGEFAQEPEVGGGSRHHTAKTTTSAPPLDDGGAVMESDGEEQSDSAHAQPAKVVKKAKKHKRTESLADGEGILPLERAKRTRHTQDEAAPPARKRKDASAKSRAVEKGKIESAKVGLAEDDFFGED